MLYNAMTYNIVQILKNASQWQLNLLVLIKKQYILYVVADFYKLRVFFMRNGIVIDKLKCTGCGSCVRDCMVKAIVMDEQEHIPVMAPDGLKLCFNCQHCLAICPTGALSVNGITPGESPAKGNLPSPADMANLIRMRRSIRQFSDKELNKEKLEILIDSLHWSPTGCNDHRLRFFVAGKNEIAEFRKITDRYLRFMIKSGLMSLLVPRYKRYFDDILKGEDVIYRNAPHMIVVMSPKKAPCTQSDPVIALTQFDLFAQSCNVGTCWCGFAERAFKMIPSLRRMIGCPRDYYVGGAMLFGTPSVSYCRASNPEKFDVSYRIKK